MLKLRYVISLQVYHKTTFYYMESYLRPDENFAPSSGVRNQWLHTPKHQKSIAGITDYGLFETYRFERCIIALIAIIVVEAIAFGIFFQEVISNTKVKNPNQIIFLVLALIVVDFILALASHKDQDKICLIHNLIMVEDDPLIIQALQDGPIDRQNPIHGITKSLSFYNSTKNIFRFIIYLFAAVKIAAFAGYHNPQGGSRFDGTFWFISVLYLLAGYLHVTFTGYLYYVWTFRRNVKREHDIYVSSRGQRFSYNRNARHERLIETPIGLILANQGDQEIRKDATNANMYRLTTLGILTDTELNYLVSCQENSDQKVILHRQGKRHQIEQLSQNPVRR
jgi:hypothetical protein